LAAVIDLLYRISRTRTGSVLISWLLRNMKFTLPLKYLRETKTLLAFYHPKPLHSFHVILIPRRKVVSLEEVSVQDTDFLVDLFLIVRSLVQEFDLNRDGYRLISNGGKYQEFGLLHFHLISGDIKGTG